MNYSTLSLTIFLCTLGLMSAPGFAQATSDLPIRVTPHRSIDGNLYGWGQDIDIEGEVHGDVGAVNGNVTVSGVVEGNVNVLNGNVHLTKTAVIEGNIVCLGGLVTIQPGHRVDGRVLNYFKSSSPHSGKNRTFKAVTATYFAQCLIMFLLVVILFYIFPNQVSEASFHLSQDLVRPFFIGLIAMTALIFLLFFSLLLMVVVIGLPLLLLLLCAYVVIASFGVVVLVFRTASALREKLREKVSLLLCLFAIVLATVLILHIPYLRTILVLGLIILGTGIVIETRFGTNKQWFTRKKRYWSAG